MELKSVEGQAQVVVSDAAFGAPFNEALVHQLVTAYLAGGRAGTRAQKTRSDVSGGGAKPWKQKGSGRARAGTIRSPLWRHGGVTFAARPQDYGQKLNRKMYRAGMRSILSELARQDRLQVADSIAISEPRTKALLTQLKQWSIGSDARVLLVVESISDALQLAARNLYRVRICEAARVNPVSLVGAEHVVVERGALAVLEGWLQ
ncbi:50S ribosomal protein L4 [Candidatus Macondimonas diazotrophica]|jgi:large subunit ribosomal protein L4|uniref:Large ribosomal subunit protein uL4 n=1 Tax=Candidatus Macondimonas diazotrophica TaxID=2305248 RepID=A0A4Z0F8S6_9GAMM|nr:50S ribosomal protein L4 [Candidatus Macondimonas diazotrophica]NCU01409.1 50S ribosomal protein L4 [Candidatus Macondimonas diazotrophica]TFZ81956.1 50S ribosomal protein L4 [Candidatus Macondimonas diazotrophica]HBG31366.1 50S ribosomal protein L4 [Gammaproteobacteria bacterium]